jgi:hypothetical protein
MYLPKAGPVGPAKADYLTAETPEIVDRRGIDADKSRFLRQFVVDNRKGSAYE